MYLCACIRSISLPVVCFLFIHVFMFPRVFIQISMCSLTYLSIYPFIHLSMYPSIYRSMFLCCLCILCIYLWIYVVDVFCLSPLSIWFWFVYRCVQSISFFVYLSVYLFLSIYLSLYFCLSILSVYLCLSYLALSYFWTKNAQMHTEPIGAKGSTALAPRGISHLTPSRGLGTMAKKSHFMFFVIKKRLIWVWHLQRLVMPAFWRCQTRDGIDTGRRRFLREETHIVCIIWHVWPGCWFGTVFWNSPRIFQSLCWLITFACFGLVLTTFQRRNTFHTKNTKTAYIILSMTLNQIIICLFFTRKFVFLHCRWTWWFVVQRPWRGCNTTGRCRLSCHCWTPQPTPRARNPSAAQRKENVRNVHFSLDLVTKTI